MKYIVFFLSSIIMFMGGFIQPKTICSSYLNSPFQDSKSNYLLAIVIDDFGSEDRHGVNEVLSLDIPLTCAIMPALPNTTNDAEIAHQKGHEVILHMPMEASHNLPLSWYGPKLVKNSDTPEEAVAIVDECLSEIPYVVGMNIHIGTGVSSNTTLLSAIMNSLKSKDIYFLDSKTTELTKCSECATVTNFTLLSRDVFIENHNNHSYEYAKNSLLEAKRIAKENGFAIAIGHVGPEGGETTARAIRDSIEDFKKEGITFVKLSEIYNLMKKSV